MAEDALMDVSVDYHISDQRGSDFACAVHLQTKQASSSALQPSLLPRSQLDFRMWLLRSDIRQGPASNVRSSVFLELAAIV